MLECGKCSYLPGWQEECRCRKEVIALGEQNLNPPGKEVEKATQGLLDAWTDRYAHTKVGKVLKFLGFGSK
jgi:hypothetical protein